MSSTWTNQVQNDCCQPTLQLEVGSYLCPTGLFYWNLPKTLYVHQYAGRVKNIRGNSSAGQDKARVTMILCVNSTGTCKIPIAVIGTAAAPRCFKGKPPLTYLSQSSAWLDADIAQAWFNKIFLPNIRRFTAEPVLLIWDNFKAHDLGTHSDSQVKTVFLPANKTSLLQPLDQGIIENVKRLYRRTVVESIFKNLNCLEAMRFLSKKKPAGTRGLDDGCLPNARDVLTIVNRVWIDEVQQPAIVNCWLKTHIQPEVHHDALLALSNSKTAVSNPHLPIDQLCLENAHRLEVSSAKLAKEMEAWYRLESDVTFMRDIMDDTGSSEESDGDGPDGPVSQSDSDCEEADGSDRPKAGPDGPDESDRQVRPLSQSDADKSSIGDEILMNGGSAGRTGHIDVVQDGDGPTAVPPVRGDGSWHTSAAADPDDPRNRRHRSSRTHAAATWSAESREFATNRIRYLNELFEQGLISHSCRDKSVQKVLSGLGFFNT